MTYYELIKIITSSNPIEEIIKNEESIFKMIPELKICKGFDQKSIWHPYDIYEHILHVIENVENDEVSRLAALFHDIGKPKVFFLDENGQGHFYNHWRVSIEIFNEFSDKYQIDKPKRNTIVKLIEYHDYNLAEMKDKTLVKYTEKFTEAEIRKLFDLKRSDLLAQSEKFHYKLQDYDTQKNRMLILKKRKKLENNKNL